MFCFNNMLVVNYNVTNFQSGTEIPLLHARYVNILPGYRLPPHPRWPPGWLP